MKRFTQLAALGVWLLAGCSLVVGGEPRIICQSDEGCPANERCATATGQCVAASKACTADSCGAGRHCDAATLACVADAVTEPDAAPSDDDDETPETGPADATPGPDGRPAVVSLGDSCQGQADCSQILVRSQTVHGVCAIQALTGLDQPSVCTVHCCKLADCPSNTYCAFGPNAGRYCVPFDKLRPRPTGTKTAGAHCTQNDECATGRCEVALPGETSQKTCIDTCCQDSDCGGGGLVCGLREGEDNRLEWVCREPLGPGSAGQDCSLGGAGDCKTGACYGGDPGVCTASCCSNGSCTTLGLQRCVSGSTAAGTSRVNICAEDNGGLAPGAPCTTDSQCGSSICVGLKCGATCCVDADCDADKACIADGTESRPHCAQ